MSILSTKLAINKVYDHYELNNYDTSKCTELALAYKQHGCIDALNLMFELSFHGDIQDNEDWLIFLLQCGATVVKEYIFEILITYKFMTYLIKEYKLNEVEILSQLIDHGHFSSGKIDSLTLLIDNGADFNHLSNEIIKNLIDNGCGTILNKAPIWRNYEGAVPYVENNKHIKQSILSNTSIADSVIDIIIEYMPFKK